MSNCQDKPTFLPEAVWKALMNLPALRYMKAPVNTEAELYQKYPIGNEKGTFAFVHNDNTFYTYHPRGFNRGRWKPIAGGMESFFEIDAEFLKEGDILVYDSSKQKFVVKSGNVWNKLLGDLKDTFSQVTKFLNQTDEIPTDESDSGVYFVHKDEENTAFRALYIVLGKKVIKIFNSSDYRTKEEVDTELAKKANQTQVDDIAASVDILAVTKAEKSVVDALQNGIIKQPAVDTYNDTSGGKTSLLNKYPNPQKGWDVLVREENTRYNWNGTEWVNMETGVYDETFRSSLSSVKSLVIDPTALFTDEQVNALKAIKDIQIYNGDINTKYAIQVFVADHTSNAWRVWITDIATSQVNTIRLNHDTPIAWTEYTNSAGVTFKILVNWTGLSGVILNGVVSNNMILSPLCFKSVNVDNLQSQIDGLDSEVKTIDNDLSAIINKTGVTDWADSINGLSSSNYGATTLRAWGFPVGVRDKISKIQIFGNNHDSTQVRVIIKEENYNGNVLFDKIFAYTTGVIDLGATVVNASKVKLWVETYFDGRSEVARTGTTAQIYTAGNGYPAIRYSADANAINLGTLPTVSSNMDIKVLLYCETTEYMIKPSVLPPMPVNNSNLIGEVNDYMSLDWTMYADQMLNSSGVLVAKTSYNSTKIQLDTSQASLYGRGLTYISFYDSSMSLLKYISHNVAGELNKPTVDEIPQGAIYAIFSNYKAHTNPYASYFENPDGSVLIKTTDGEVIPVAYQSQIESLQSQISGSAGQISKNIRICCAGSSVTWGTGFLQDSMLEYLIPILQKLRTHYIGIENITAVGNQTTLNSANDRLLFDKKATRLEGAGSTIDFDISGDEISIVQAMDRSNSAASLIEMYVDGALYDTFSNFNTTDIGHETKSFNAVANQKEYPLQRPFTFNHILKVNGVTTPVSLSKSSTAPTTGWVIARDIMDVNGKPIVQHTLFNIDGSSAGDTISIEYDYGAELRYERTTIGKDGNGILENPYGRGYTAFDPANPPTSFGFGTGLDFRYTDERVIQKYTFNESKKRHVQLKIKGLDSRATGTGTPYFIFNFATSRILYFMNAGIGGWKSSQFNDPTNASGNILRTWREAVEFKPTHIFYESTPNDDWTVYGYKLYTSNSNLSLAQLQAIRTLPNKKIEYNTSNSTYLYERWAGKIAAIDKWSLQLSADTLINAAPSEGDSIVIGTYYSDARQCVARLIRSYDAATKTITFDRPINEFEYVYDSLQDFIGQEVQVRDLSGYTNPTDELLDKLKGYGNNPYIYLVPNPFPNQRSRDLRAYQPLLDKLSHSEKADGYVGLPNVYDWQFSQPRDKTITVEASTLVSNADGSKSVDLTGLTKANNFMDYQVLVNGLDVTNKDAFVFTSYCLGVDRSLSGAALNDTATRGKQVWGNFYPTLVFKKNAPASGTITIKCTTNLWSADSCHMNDNSKKLYAIGYNKFIE